MVTDDTENEAVRRGEQFMRENPRVVEARYDCTRNRMVVLLSSEVELVFDPRHYQGLETATTEELVAVEILGVGYGLHWPLINADIYIPGLLKGLTGSKSYMERRAAEKQAA